MYRYESDRMAQAVVQDLRRRWFGALATLVMTVVVGTVGFVILDPARAGASANLGDLSLMALWETLNIVTTVGAIPQNEFTGLERIWAIGIVVFGLGAVLYGFGSLQALLHGGELFRVLERRRMERSLDEIRGHFVLCGYGRVGASVARHIHHESGARPLVVVERDDARAEEADRLGFLTVRGDCGEEGVLRRAGLERAEGLIAALDSDAANVFLCLMARQINPQVRIVTRSERVETRSILQHAGADRVTVPGELAATTMSQLLLKPRVSEFVAAATAAGGEFEFAEVEVGRYRGLVGKSLRDVNFPRRADALVVAISDAENKLLFNPKPDRELMPGDTLILVCKVGGAGRIESLVSSEA